jgi:hypothetical protein
MLAELITSPGAGVVGLLCCLLACWTVYRRNDLKKQHRSFAQWVIYRIRVLSQWLWAVHVGFDMGYLRYRQTLAAANKEMEIENERELGLIVGRAAQEEA